MYEVLKERCEAMKADLSVEIEELNETIKEKVGQHKRNYNEINLHHDLCAVSKALSKAINTINVYFEEK